MASDQVFTFIMAPKTDEHFTISRFKDFQQINWHVVIHAYSL